MCVVERMGVMGVGVGVAEIMCVCEAHGKG